MRGRSERWARSWSVIILGANAAVVNRWRKGERKSTEEEEEGHFGERSSEIPIVERQVRRWTRVENLFEPCLRSNKFPFSNAFGQRSRRNSIGTKFRSSRDHFMIVSCGWEKRGVVFWIVINDHRPPSKRHPWFLQREFFLSRGRTVPGPVFH